MRVFFACAIAACVAVGCDARADERRSISAAMLPCQRVAEGGSWETAPLPSSRQACTNDEKMDCEWVAYGGRDTLEFEHPLGHPPSDVLVYLSFHRHGCGGALTVGDTARIQEANSRTVSIHNASEEDYFVRITLR
jgi:hypothetical protein